MPALNQNIVIYDLDRFFVRFTVTDNVEALTGASVWWGVATAEAGGDSTVKIQKTNDSNMGSVDYGDLTLSSTTIDCEVQLNTGSSGATQYQSGSINISPGTYPGTYYHELVFSGQNNPDQSVVIATGTITVKQSLFTEAGYRA